MIFWVVMCTTLFGAIIKVSYLEETPEEVSSAFGFLSIAIFSVPTLFFAITIIYWHLKGEDAVDEIAGGMVPVTLVLLVLLTFLSFSAMQHSLSLSPPKPLINVSE